MRSSPLRRRRPGCDQGDTLIELLCAVVILGIAGVAIMAGFSFLVKSSDLGRKQATGQAYVRSLAEAIQRSIDTTGGYKPCAAAGAYVTAATKGAAGIPSKYTIVTQSAAQSWNGAAWGACSTDRGAQRVELTVGTGGVAGHAASEKMTVILRQPCSGTPGATAC